MVSVFTQPDVNTREVGRTRDKRIELIECIPTSQVFTSGYVNTETILHFFYKITNERGTKTVFTYARVKWFYGQSERAYYLNYFIKTHCCTCQANGGNQGKLIIQIIFFQLPISAPAVTICQDLRTVYLIVK